VSDAPRQARQERSYPPLEGSAFVHPFADAAMIAGHGTIGLEILEDCNLRVRSQTDDYPVPGSSARRAIAGQSAALFFGSAPGSSAAFG